MPLKILYNPDGSVKSVVSVNPDGTPKVEAGNEYPIIVKYREDGSIKSAIGQKKPLGFESSYTPMPVLGSMPQATQPSLDAILGNVKVDPITGKSSKRTFDDFKNFVKINKEAFIRDKGKFEGFRGGGIKSFNAMLDDLQEGKIDKLTEEEAKYVDDLKNNRINL